MRYRKVENLKLRPVNEWNRCFVFTPSNPKLTLLNMSSWFVMECCDDATLKEIERRYEEATSRKLQPGEVEDCLRSLEGNGIIKSVPSHENLKKERDHVER